MKWIWYITPIALITYALLFNYAKGDVLGAAQGRHLFDDQGVQVYTDCDLAAPKRQNLANDLSALKAQNPDKSFRALNALEKANVKGCEIAKLKSSPRQNAKFSGADYDIEIVSMEPIEGGVQVFARAWNPDGTQIGFGADGSVDIERFVIQNPPVLVPDSSGTVLLEQYDVKGAYMGTDRYREDAATALLQALTHTVSVAQNKHDASRIEPGKRGNTTYTFYAEAGDGRTGYINQSSWSTPRSANGSTANATDYLSNNIQIGAEDESAGANDFAILRGFFPFITSSIVDTDTVSSATFSVWVQTVGAGERIYGLILTTQATTTQVVGTDYDNLTLNTPTEGASRMTLTSTTTYTNATLNASGISWVSKVGNTLLGLRHQDDIDNTQPAAGRQYMHVHSSEAIGTTNDPKLVVETSGAGGGAAPATDIIWFN